MYEDLLMMPLPIEEFDISKGLSDSNKILLNSLKANINDFEVKEVWFGKNYLSQMYGKIICIFSYNSHMYRLMFNVHRPKQGSSVLSNKPESISEVRQMAQHNLNGEIFVDNYYEDTSFGFKAFWNRTPISHLDGESFLLRLLINKIISYSRRENFCGQLRKTDAQVLRFNAMFG